MESFEFLIEQLDLSHAEKQWALHYYQVRNCITSMRNAERKFEKEIASYVPQEAARYLVILDKIINRERTFVKDRLVDLHEALNGEIPEYYRDKIRKHPKDKKDPIDGLDDKDRIRLLLSLEISVALDLSQGIILYAEKAKSALSLASRSPKAGKGKDFLTHLGWHEEKAQDLRRLWLKEKLIESIDEACFCYFMTGRGAIPIHGIKWKGTVKELVIYLNELSSTEHPEWSRAEKIFVGMKRTSLKSTYNRLKERYDNDKDVIRIRELLRASHLS